MESSDFFLFLIAVCFPFIIFLFYAYGYCSHKLFNAGTVVFDYQKDVPSFLYLVCRFVLQALRKTRGQLYDNDLLARSINQLTFTFYNCRLEPNNLRWYCSAFGYGWDYPDSSFRDIPLCYPEVLFFRLLAMIVCSEEFRLSPLGLTNVRKSMRTLQAIDELKKGPFSLQASVREYRTVEVGIEVDIALDVTDRASKPVWAGLVTLLSRDTKKLNKWQPACGSHEPKEVKTIELNAPWYTGLKCAYASWNYNPHHLFSSIAKLLGYKHPTVHSLWMISRCLAEIEKHEGVVAVSAPVSVEVDFKQPLLMPGKAVIKFWETSPNGCTSSRKIYHVRMEESELKIPLLEGDVTGVESSS